MDSSFIATSIGEVQVLEDVDGVIVRFHANDRKAISVGFEEGDMTMTVSTRKRPPARYSEVTQNGSTFEVLDVRQTGGGYDLLNGNTKTWERWVED